MSMKCTAAFELNKTLFCPQTMTPGKPSIVVYRDSGVTSSYTWSPFVAKLETRLRFSHLPYSVQAGSLSDSPKGKLPYVRIEDRDKNSSSLISDSTWVTRTLIRSRMIDDLNANLSPAQRASDLAIRALLEEKLYFMTTRERWMDNFYVMRDQGPLATLPYPIRLIVGWMVHSKISRTLYGQGTGRYTTAESNALKLEGWTALDELIAGTRQNTVCWILGGENPTEADACLHGFLASSLTSPANPELKSIIQGLPHLMSYANKIHDLYFLDYQKWT